MSTYVYMRYSTDKQTEARQQHCIEEYCKKNDIKPDASFCDHAKSGSMSFSKRRQGAELMGLVKSGDIVIASDMDRLGRSALDVLDAVKFFTQEKGVKLHIVNFKPPVVDITDPVGLIIVTVMAAVAQMERGFAASRARESKAARDALGILTRKDAPIGYRLSSSGGRSFKKDQEQWPTMSCIITLWLSGLAPERISWELNKDNKHRFNKFGVYKTWSIDRIRQFLDLWKLGYYPQVPFTPPDPSNAQARNLPWDGEEPTGVGEPAKVLSDTEAALAIRRIEQGRYAEKRARKIPSVRDCSKGV